MYRQLLDLAEQLMMCLHITTGNKSISTQSPPISHVQTAEAKLPEFKDTTWKVLDKIADFGGYGRGEFERCQ
jgi:hypothetical protein